jgi:hypothetical protein
VRRDTEECREATAFLYFRALGEGSKPRVRLETSGSASRLLDRIKKPAVCAKNKSKSMARQTLPPFSPSWPKTRRRGTVLPPVDSYTSCASWPPSFPT